MDNSNKILRFIESKDKVRASEIEKALVGKKEEQMSKSVLYKHLKKFVKNGNITRTEEIKKVYYASSVSDITVEEIQNVLKKLEISKGTDTTRIALYGLAEKIEGFNQKDFTAVYRRIHSPKLVNFIVDQILSSDISENLSAYTFCLVRIMRSSIHFNVIPMLKHFAKIPKTKNIETKLVKLALDINTDENLRYNCCFILTIFNRKIGYDTLMRILESTIPKPLCVHAEGFSQLLSVAIDTKEVSTLDVLKRCEKVRETATTEDRKQVAGRIIGDLKL